MQYAQKKFNVMMPGGSSDDLAKRWEDTFGKKADRDSVVADQRNESLGYLSPIGELPVANPPAVIVPPVPRETVAVSGLWFRSRGLSSAARQQALEYSNWSAKRNGWLVWRLQPGRAVRLHGTDASAWESAVAQCPLSLQDQYALVARGCPPGPLRKMALSLQQLLTSTGVAEQRMRRLAQ
jgi:hypothetical protein